LRIDSPAATRSKSAASGWSLGGRPVTYGFYFRNTATRPFRNVAQLRSRRAGDGETLPPSGHRNRGPFSVRLRCSVAVLRNRHRDPPTHCQRMGKLTRTAPAKAVIQGRKNGLSKRFPAVRTCVDSGVVRDSRARVESGTGPSARTHHWKDTHTRGSFGNRVTNKEHRRHPGNSPRRDTRTLTVSGMSPRKRQAARTKLVL
jgi:hypothetical protein